MKKLNSLILLSFLALTIYARQNGTRTSDFTRLADDSKGYRNLDPGRPKIINNSLYSADGRLIRGDNPFYHTLDDWKENVSIGFNARRLFWNPKRTFSELDTIVDLAASTGQYIIIAYANKGIAGTSDHWNFWSAAADRYKDRTHVIYDLCNEPLPDSWPSSTETYGGVAMAKMVRDKAPNTIIITHSLNGTIVRSFGSPFDDRTIEFYKEFEDNYKSKYGTSWDWSKSLIGFHGYYKASYSSMQTLHNWRPCICTELPSYYWDVDSSRATSIEQDWEEVVSCEKLGIAWIHYNHTTRQPYGEAFSPPDYYDQQGRVSYHKFYSDVFKDYMVRRGVPWWINGPSVSITAPSYCSTYTAPASITLNAKTNGRVTKVEYFNGAKKIGESKSSPFTINLDNVAVGAYSITAKAYNAGGSSYTSFPLEISVLTTNLTKSAINGASSGSAWNGYETGKSFDENLTSRWSNDGVLSNAWIQYDLGSMQNVAAVKLKMFNGRTLNYPLKIEVDGVSIWSGTTMWWAGMQTFDVEDKRGRYVRVTMTGNNCNENAWFSIYETEILTIH